MTAITGASVLAECGGLSWQPIISHDILLYTILRVLGDFE